MVRWIWVGAVILLGVRQGYFYLRPSPYQSGNEVRINATVATKPFNVYQKEYVVVEGIAVEVPAEMQVDEGDRIQVTGTLTDSVISSSQVKFGLINGNFQILEANNRQGLWLTRLRHYLIRRLYRWLPGDEGALAAGILLGGSEDMTDKMRDNFRRTGLMHVVAASGYNVTLVAGWTLFAFSRIWHRRVAALASLVSILVYVLLAGATAAVVRAGVMASAGWLGKLLGREASSLWLVCLAVWIMLMANPGYLTDIGFQLSVAATVGIVVVSPRSDLWTSIAAQVMTIPIILHYFGDLSIVAPVVNVGLLWLVGPLMQILAVGLVIGPVSWLAWPGLKLFTIVVNWVGQMPWAAVKVDPVSWPWVIAYYILLYIVWNRKLRKVKWAS